MSRMTPMKRALLLVVSLTLTLLVAGAALAQTTPATPQKPAAGEKPKPATEAQKTDEQVPTLDVSVTVSAPRVDIPLKDTPAATTVIGELTLKSLPRAVGAEEALQMVPGMKVDNQADGERVHMSIRGQGLLTERGIRGITVLLDGIPLNDPSGFVPDLFDVDWSNVSRLEVFRGVASALYGGASAGGIISIATKDGGAGKPSGDVAVDGGSYNFLKGSAAIGGTSGNLNYHVSASGNRGDGYRLHANFDAWNLYGKARWTPSSTTQLTAIVSGTNYYNGNAEGLNLAWTPVSLGQPVSWARMANPDSITFNEYQRTRRLTAGVTGKTRLADNQDLSYVVFYRRTGWQESVPSSVDHRTYDNPGANLQYVRHSAVGSAKNHLTVGADVSWQGIDEIVHPNLGNAVEGPDVLANQTISQRGIGIYAIDRVEFTPQWGAMLSLRHDGVRNELTDALKAGGVDLSGLATFAKTTGRVGVSFNPRADVGVYAAWGQGFLPPATEELARNPDRIGGFNTHLVPATSQGQEFGVRGGARGFSYDVAFFHLTTDNDFGRYRVTSRPLETFYGNVGTSRRYGLETSVGYYPTPDLAIRGAYTYSNFLYTNVQFMFDHFTDKVMPNSPKHQVAFDVEYSLDRNWVLGVNAFGQSFQYVEHSNTLTADGFTLVNPRIAYRWNGKGYTSEVMLQARNVLGKEYIAFTEPDPDGNSFQPGPTRELFVGLRVGFGK
jgi:iron complex outermembrane receptor protein